MFISVRELKQEDAADEANKYLKNICFRMYYLIYLLTAIGLSPSGSSTVHIYTQTVHRTTQNKQ